VRLHASPTSPYARKVRIALIETGQGVDVEMVAASGTPLDASAMPVEANPLGKIPVLERPDGPALYDSRVICRFLDHRAGGGLYPEAPGLWEALTLEATAEGMLDAAVAMVYETRLRDPAQDGPVRHRGRARLSRPAPRSARLACGGPGARCMARRHHCAPILARDGTAGRLTLEVEAHTEIDRVRQDVGLKIAPAVEIGIVARIGALVLAEH
jgi:hypothetical protein